MFYILDKREKFYQWDKGRKIDTTDETITEAHFYISSDLVIKKNRKEDENGTYFEVPDEILEKAGNFKVYGYGDGYTHFEQIFAVEKRPKPAV